MADLSLKTRFGKQSLTRVKIDLWHPKVNIYENEKRNTVEKVCRVLSNPGYLTKSLKSLLNSVNITVLFSTRNFTNKNELFN